MVSRKAAAVENGARRRGSDCAILVPVLCLLVLGLVFVHSASASRWAHAPGDSLSLLERQALCCLLGCGLMAAARRIPCTAYLRWLNPLLLVIFLVPWILPILTGSDHWIGWQSPWSRWPGHSFQLADVARFLLIVHVAQSMAEGAPKRTPFSRHLWPRLAVPGAFVSLMLLHGDLGTVFVLGSAVLILLVVGGVSRLLLLSFSILYTAAVGLLLKLLCGPYFLARLLSMIQFWERPQFQGYGLFDPASIFRAASLLGVGPGHGTLKLTIPPEVLTESVLLVVVEELGLLGLMAIVALFALLIAGGIRVARNARDLYGRHLALGVTCLIGLQVVAKLGVTTGGLYLLPVALPLIGYGGSSVVVTLFFVGILLGISSRRGSGTHRAPATGGA